MIPGVAVVAVVAGVEKRSHPEWMVRLACEVTAKRPVHVKVQIMVDFLITSNSSWIVLAPSHNQIPPAWQG